MKKTEQNGRSMIEMLGVLAIIGILSVGGFSLVNKMQGANEVNKILDELSTLATKSRVVIRDYDGAAGAINKYICTSKAIPDEFWEAMELDSDGKCTDSDFVGSGDILYKVYYIGDKVVYAIEASNLSEEACMQIATTNWGGPGTSGFIGMSVGDSYSAVNGSIKNGGENMGIVGNIKFPAPMPISRAAKSCYDGVAIYLSFR